MTGTRLAKSVFELEPWDAANASGCRVACTLLEDSLNLKKNREKRTSRISDLLGFDGPHPLFIPNQQHTNHMVEVAGIDPDGNPLTTGGSICSDIEADGYWTTRQDIILAVRTADCVPILVFSPEKPFVAAIHSGWRGTKSRILGECLRIARKQNVPLQSLKIWIGPRISGEIYEVSTDLADAFEEAFSEFTSFRKERFIDLGKINMQIALEAGISIDQISISNLCTFTKKDLFPSYRRDGECKGEILSAITLIQH